MTRSGNSSSVGLLKRAAGAVRAVNGSCLLLVGLFLAASLAGTAGAQTGYSGIFGGGPYYKGNVAANIHELEYSGFTEAIVWSIEVSSTGDLNFNGEFPLTSNGVYVGNQTYPNFPADLAQLKQGTVRRVTFSIGSSNYGDWENITALVEAQGTGPGSILYEDFQALQQAIPVLDALDFDDENSYNLPTTVQFGVMLGNMGFHVLPDAYDNSSYWMDVVSGINSQLPGTVDGVHLQVYSGGAGNNPCSQTWNFGSVPVFPGLWDKEGSPGWVEKTMRNWHNECDIIGGFMWIYDDFVGTGLAAKYAKAIDDAVGIGGFTVSGPSSVYLNQNGTAKTPITIADFGIFDSPVSLSLSALPSGVTGSFQGTGNKQTLVLKASSSASTGYFPVTVTGTSGETSETFSFTLAVSAAIGLQGSGTEVNLSSAFDVYGIYKNGTTYSTGGLDGEGNSYSAELLMPTRTLDLMPFKFGAVGEPDAIGCNGQSVSLPQGQFGTLALLGTGVQGSQISQTFTVNYTDGSNAQFVQSFSDWGSPQNFPGETEAVAMPYNNTDRSICTGTSLRSIRRRQSRALRCQRIRMWSCSQ